MPINPVTLDKLEPIVVKQIGMKVVDRIVHEIKGAEIQKENSDKNKKGFNKQKQEESSRHFADFLAKYNLKFQYKVLKDKVKVKVIDKNGALILETELEDVERLLQNVKSSTGSIIDIKG